MNDEQQVDIFDVTLEQAQEMLARFNFDVVDFDESRPWRVWVRTGNGSQKLIYFREYERKSPSSTPVFAIHDPNYIGGKYRWVEHRKTGAKDLVHDLANRNARETWDNYRMEYDSSGNLVREGPAPFGSDREKKAYYKKYGFREIEKGDGIAEYGDD